MAKRFIDTGLFDDEWFSELSQESKLFWIYYVTKCDHAGLLKYNKKLIEFQTGIKSLDTVIEELGKRLVRVKEELLFCPKFITFQYPGFPKSGVKQQDGAISLLTAVGLWDTKANKFQRVSELLPKSYVNDNGNDTVIVTGNDNGVAKIEFWITSLKADEQWCEVMGMNHKGKNLDDAIRQALGHAVSDKAKFERMELSDLKKLVNTWLSNTRIQREKPNAYQKGKFVQ